MIGQRLAHYEILSALGKGGMGEVWRARDTKLGRDVAIKTLPEEFARDADRLARFEREAKLLASLNHPNIAAIHGFDEDNGTHFLVLELVEGDTLADRIGRGAIPVEESLQLAVQIAAALEAAHDKGVIHRDLKPANIKITNDDTAKVLDFGLAKAFAGDKAGDPSNSPTLSIAATQQGVTLGTAAYMSPEQAKGRSTDKRTDVFAFGCVLYECLTGKPAFDGESITETLAATIHKEPDWELMPVNTPPHVVRQLKRCFEKDPKKRTRDMGDVALELEDGADPDAAPAQSKHSMRWAILVPVILLLILGSYSAGVWNSNASETIAEARWFGEKLGGPAVAHMPVVSPDGTRVAFVGFSDEMGQVWVTEPGVTGGARQLTRDRSQGGAGYLAWSRDGSRIFYSGYGTQTPSIRSVAAVGEPETRFELDNATDARPLANGELLAVRKNDDRVPQLIRYTPGSISPEILPVLLTDLLIDQAVRIVPGEAEAVVMGRPEGSAVDALHIWVVDLDTYEMKRIAPDVELPPLSWTFPLAASTDEAYFVRPQGDLYEVVAVPLDGSPGVRSVQTLTGRPLFIDVDDDARLYLDQIDQATEVLRIDPVTGATDLVLPSSGSGWVLPLPDDRFVVASDRGAQDRLVVVTPGASPAQFLNVDEEARGPLTRVGEDEVAFPIGPIGSPQLAIATIDGRLQLRIPIDGRQITGLSASPDGAVLYYAFDGVIYSVPSTGGESEPVHSGDAVAVDPTTGELIILFMEAEGRLVRVTPGEGEEMPLPLAPSEWWIASQGGPSGKLAGQAVSADGKVVVRMRGPLSWYWPVGVFDARAGGALEPPTDPTQFDMFNASWDREGRLVMLVHPLRSELWRFRLEAVE